MKTKKDSSWTILCCFILCAIVVVLAFGDSQWSRFNYAFHNSILGEGQLANANTGVAGDIQILPPAKFSGVWYTWKGCRIRSEIFYNNGVKHGKASIYEGGVIKEVDLYKFGKYVDTIEYWAEGRIKYKKAYNDNFKPSGEWLRYDHEGHIHCKTIFDHGAIISDKAFFDDPPPEGFTGVWKAYYPTGRPFSITEYRLGMKCGYEIEFWENGLPKNISNYENNDLSGNCYYVSQNGNITDIQQYVKNNLDGIWCVWKDNIETLFLYSSGELKGKLSRSDAEERGYSVPSLLGSLNELLFSIGLQYGIQGNKVLPIQKNRLMQKGSSSKNGGE